MDSVRPKIATASAINTSPRNLIYPTTIDDVRPDRVRPKSVLGSGLFLDKSSLGRANRALRLGQQQSRNIHARPSVAAKAALCPSRCKIRHLRVGHTHHGCGVARMDHMAFRPSTECRLRGGSPYNRIVGTADSETNQFEKACVHDPFCGKFVANSGRLIGQKQSSTIRILLRAVADICGINADVVARSSR